MKHRFLLAGLMFLFSLSLSAETYSGTCGTNLTWTLDTESGILTISGTGAMTNYTYSSKAPWYSYSKSIKTITIDNSVTWIGDYAFKGCSSLTSVTIPNSVTRIGHYAFYECSSLTSVTIPNSVTTIGSWTFNGCSSLTAVHISDIAAWCKIAFGPGSLSHYNLYLNGTLITDLVIPDGVTSIGDYAFYGCSSLTSITIPNSVTSIGDYAFIDCRSLTSITIPNSVTRIGEEAFCGCTSLTSVTIGNSVTSIGSEAFYGCSSLTSITIPNSVTSIGSYAFSGCTSLTSPVFNAHVFAKMPQSYSGAYTIPDGIESIAGGAFYKCSSLTSATIGNSVKSIGNNAFAGCSSLTSIIIPNSVTIIGYWAFDGCSNLTSITIPNSVTFIGSSAFSGCSGLTSIVVENGNTKYDSRNNCNAIIETATNTLIAGCQATTIPNSVTSIGSDAFCNCSSLTSVTIPNSVTSIGNDAFWGCISLTSITIPNSVTSIGYDAFKRCINLTSITIPNSVTSIGNGAFAGCDKLTSVIVESGNSTYDSRNNCNAIIETATNTLIAGCQATTIPNSVTSIGERAFSECSSLTSVTIPNSVTSIGRYAFDGCTSLTSIAIPNSVISIGYEAFHNCTGLTTLTCEAVAPPTLENRVFDGVDKSIPLYVPAESMVLYKAADQWKDFTNILPIPDVEPQKYTITWQDEDGNVIKTDQVAQGTTPAFTGTTPTKTATNEYTYEFAGWLPKIQPATKDMYYTTFFERNKIETPVYTVNINGENCSLNINNQYPEGTVITLEAVADECFEFQQWSDGNKDNPRTVTVTKDMSLTAEFNKVRYTVTGEPSTGGKVQIRKQ